MFVIDTVSGKRALETLKKKLKEKLPPSFFEEMEQAMEAVPLDRWGVMIQRREAGLVGDIAIPGNLFPQSKGWAQARIGKLVHIVETQLPNKHGGDLSFDVHDPANSVEG